MELNKKNIVKFIRQNKPELENRYGIKRIGLFGSYAKDIARQESDIDIVVEVSEPDLFILIGIKQYLEEAFGTRVDVVRLREKMNLVLKKRIDRDAIYV
ncbi:MAG: nucleotidyltransferase domain-containing protein [Candidatus Marinimicrobia bacterium]|nr:nucleotidyltransferase domain-containing protein [Candidatus Neomarinimicrobiota bacterium]MCK4445961.1 nucleotidyltransferase domain-containing protein [Candidatus Neomarinimicrobiota bacterium]